MSLHECSGQKSKTDEGSKTVKTKIGIKEKKEKEKRGKKDVNKRIFMSLIFLIHKHVCHNQI